jgi:hypothetical protein
MGTLQKIAVIGLLVAGITTMVLPGRNTPQVLTAGSRLITGETSTIIGTSSGAVG